MSEKKIPSPRISEELKKILHKDGIYSHTISMAKEYIAAIDDAPVDSVVKAYKDKLLGMQSKEGFLENANAIDVYMQILGEAYFYCFCKSCGLDIKKILPTADQSTPDFSIQVDGVVIFFEVKTPGLVNGSAHTKKHIVRYRRGERATTYAPYTGSKWPSRGHTRGPAEVINQKISNSHNSKQFTSGPTFLVINLLQLHPMPQTAEALCPIYVNQATENLESGLLWTTAFANKGMLSFNSNVAFPNAPIDGYLDGNGLLVDNREIFGILFAIQRAVGNRLIPDIFGCLRSSEYKYEDSEKDATLWEAHSKIVSINEKVKKYLVDDFYGWNDDKDSNGCRLRRRGNIYRRDAETL